MSERDHSIFLKDILDSADKILRYVSGKSYGEFIEDEMLIDANEVPELRNEIRSILREQRGKAT